MIHMGSSVPAPSGSRRTEVIPMMTRILGLVALTTLLFMNGPVATEEAEARPMPVECYPGIDGTTVCIVNAPGCEVGVSVHPERGVGVDPSDC